MPPRLDGVPLSQVEDITYNRPERGSGKEETMSGTTESLVGRAIDLKELIAYQEGSVVSRTLNDKKVGTITLFAFGEGQGLSEHTAPYDAFVEIVDGDADITIAGTDHRVTAGQFIIMPANQPHSLRAVTRFKMLLVMIRA
ncbi:putative monooxygenase [Geobacteraceae bacterium]|nr:putative monooxygenase [Geobacteraceae bacterium]